MSGFRFKLNGHRVDDALFSSLRRARGTHGDLAFVEAKAANVFEVTMASGDVRKLSGTVRLSNLLQADIAGEPARRAAYRAAHPLPKAPNGDERFVASSAIEPDAAHHRGFRFKRVKED